MLFDIDIVSFSIAVILIIAFIIPFYWYSRKSRIKELKAIKCLGEYAMNLDLEMHLTEFWRSHYFIGLDRNKGKVIYADNLLSPSPVIIDLRNIKKVKVEEASRKIVTPKETRKVIDKLELNFVGENNKTVMKIEFYDGDKFSDLNGESVLIKKWEAVLQSVIDSKNKDHCETENDPIAF
jgi:hypothetical protein